VDGKQRIEEICEVYPLRLGNQAEKFAIAIEAPWPAGFSDFKRRLAIAVKEHDTGLAGRIFVGKLDRGGPVPFDIDHGDKAIRQNASDSGTPLEILQFGHRPVITLGNQPNVHDITFRLRIFLSVELSVPQTRS
jgi:hypothetical protein